MKLSELLEIQKDQQKRIGKNPETLEQIRAQLIEEAGEVARCLRPITRWWGWEGESATNVIDRRHLIEELADLLHFLLVEVLVFPPSPELAILDEDWDREWGTSKIDPRYTGQPMLCLISLLWFDSKTVAISFGRLVTVCRLLGVAREELEDAYLLKAQANAVRAGGVV